MAETIETERDPPVGQENATDGDVGGREPVDGQQTSLPAGFYRVDAQGNVHQSVNWQPVLESIPWEELDQFLDKLMDRGSKERQVNVHWTYGLVAVTIVSASFLAWHGILQGQTIAGFLGAAIGYLLTTARFDGE